MRVRILCRFNKFEQAYGFRTGYDYETYDCQTGISEGQIWLECPIKMYGYMRLERKDYEVVQ